MAKLVRYKGGSANNNLIIGETYTVISQSFNTNPNTYMLQEVIGEFDTSLFIENVIPTYLALSKTIPVVGKRTHLLKISQKNHDVELTKCRTSIVKSIQQKSNNIYEIRTENSIYILQIA